MKKLFIVLFIFLFTGCSHTYIGNTSFDKLKTATKKDYINIGLGIASSFLVHEVSHMVLIKSFGSDFDIKVSNLDPKIVWEDKNLSNNEKRWISRIGLLSQNVVGLFLPEDSYFTRGFIAMNALETISYPIRYNSGDLYELNKYGGDAGLEWGVYSLISLHNLFRIEW